MIKLISPQVIKFTRKNEKQVVSLHLQSLVNQPICVTVKKSKILNIRTDKTKYEVDGEVDFYIKIIAGEDQLHPESRTKHKIALVVTQINSNETSVDQKDQNLLTSKIKADIEIEVIFGEDPKFQSSVIRPSQIQTKYITSRIQDQSFHSVLNDTTKQQYEELLIKTDEQEKELFQLSEIKNRLQRQLNKRKVNTESIKPQDNQIHFIYALIIVILSFILGMFLKN